MSTPESLAACWTTPSLTTVDLKPSTAWVTVAAVLVPSGEMTLTVASVCSEGFEFIDRAAEAATASTGTRTRSHTALPERLTRLFSCMKVRWRGRTPADGTASRGPPTA